MIAALLLSILLGGVPLPADKPLQAALSMNLVGMKCEVIWPSGIAWYRCNLPGISVAIASDGSTGQAQFSSATSASVKSWILAITNEAICIDDKCLTQNEVNSGLTTFSFAR